MGPLPTNDWEAYLIKKRKMSIIYNKLRKHIFLELLLLTVANNYSCSAFILPTHTIRKNTYKTSCGKVERYIMDRSEITKTITLFLVGISIVTSLLLLINFLLNKMLITITGG